MVVTVVKEKDSQVQEAKARAEKEAYEKYVADEDSLMKNIMEKEMKKA